MMTSGIRSCEKCLRRYGLSLIQIARKKVESKDAMKKRTGQESPNINDAIIMLRAPREVEPLNFLDLDWSA